MFEFIFGKLKPVSELADKLRDRRINDLSMVLDSYSHKKIESYNRRADDEKPLCNPSHVTSLSDYRYKDEGENHLCEYLYNQSVK